MLVAVVEDSAMSAALYVVVLERAGHRVVTFTSKFHRLLSKGPWRGVGCALIDHRLDSQVTGGDILEFLSVHLPHIRRVSISGSELSGGVADVTLVKPVTAAQIVEAVESRG